MSKWIRPTREELEEMRRADEAVARAQAELDDQRRSLRLGLHANVTAESETNFFTGFTENISEGGVFISTFSPPPIGEEIALRLTIRGESELIVQGCVRWHRCDEQGQPVGCGVQFIDLQPRQVAVLGAMLRQAAREPLLFEA